MDWNQLRRDWRASTPPVPEPEPLAALQARDVDLRTKVRRRDRLESIVGFLVAPFFAYGAYRAGLRGEWLEGFFAAFLAAWALYVPLHLWRTRRRLPTPRPAQPLLDFLRAEHAAMLAQARQLERIWLWYLAPCAFGVIGLNFAARGPVLSVWIYTAVVIAFCLWLGRLNRRAARSKFLDHADRITQQISRLTEENGR